MGHYASEMGFEPRVPPASESDDPRVVALSNALMGGFNQGSHLDYAARQNAERTAAAIDALVRQRIAEALENLGYK